jgi:hypothetical protein
MNRVIQIALTLIFSICQSFTFAQNVKEVAWQKESDFVFLPDGVVRDEARKFEWMRCSIGQTWNGSTCAGKALQFTYEEAQELPVNIRKSGGFAKKMNWRLPKPRELHNLIYCNQGFTDYFDKVEDDGASFKNKCAGESFLRPTIHQGIFPRTQPSWYWSATPRWGPTYDVWVVNFNFGYLDTNHRYSRQGFVRLIRDI